MTSLLTNWLKNPDKAAAAPTSIAHHASLEASPLTSSISTPDSLDDLPSTPSDCDRFTMPITSPIDIATPTRNSSSSPSSQGQKPTTSANFHETDSRTSAMMSGTAFDSSMGMGRSRQDSFAGAKPISMNNPNRNAEGRMRRESLAGSLVQGMSWGGVSVGSWIRDDIIMAGNSPYPYQSPSFHSSSYLPKLEANFMKDFACCGKTLPTLHDLLQHYEECHAQQTPQSLRTASAAMRARENSTPNSKAAIASQAASAVQQQAQQQHQPQPSRPQSLQMPQGGPNVGGIQLMRQQQQSQPSTPVQNNVQPADTEMEGVEDMEMDDVGPMDNPPDTSVQQQHQPVQTAQLSTFGQPQRPDLNLNSSGLQHSGLRTSQPTTPATSGFGFQNNPTVSSVNTPTLSAQPLQQHQQTFSPDTSVPGTPAGEMEDDFSGMPMNMNMNMGMGFGYGGFGDNLGLDLCIDEPAKRLYSPNGAFNSQRALHQQFSQFGLGQGQAQLNGNQEMMRQFRNQQLMQGMGNSQAAMMLQAEEHKPFRCPVIGCEKAYKNQNGLKYHKTHGHQTQQLHENGDGTFSIVNPETSTPYPGTMGMEKEKPYKCEVCGKRYKNLNGLKYHKQHSPPCNPELKLNSHMAAAGLGGMGVNVAGLPGIGEDTMM
ncbi:Transcription factor SFP1 [Lachnellula suecica]|uniref:Transcription factor SFP1 n=1 Tax=Lachnellula suecica TaxID=602035 RepID=A0A8T9C4L5_9HELO|nr:Transcription factor SFP1 [Lachnellula suecica]